MVWGWKGTRSLPACPSNTFLPLKPCAEGVEVEGVGMGVVPGFQIQARQGKEHARFSPGYTRSQILGPAESQGWLCWFNTIQLFPVSMQPYTFPSNTIYYPILIIAVFFQSHLPRPALTSRSQSLVGFWGGIVLSCPKILRFMRQHKILPVPCFCP